MLIFSKKYINLSNYITEKTYHQFSFFYLFVVIKFLNVIYLNNSLAFFTHLLENLKNDDDDNKDINLKHQPDIK